MGAPIVVMQAGKGGLQEEMSYPDDNSPASDLWRSTFFNTWNNTNTRDNDGTAGSVITGLATSGTVATVVTGTAFALRSLCSFPVLALPATMGFSPSPLRRRPFRPLQDPALRTKLRRRLPRG